MYQSKMNTNNVHFSHTSMLRKTHCAVFFNLSTFKKSKSKHFIHYAVITRTTELFSLGVYIFTYFTVYQISFLTRKRKGVTKI